MTEASTMDDNKTWELVDEFDDIKLRTPSTSTDASLSSDHNSGSSRDDNQKLPGMTSEYRLFCNTLSEGIIPVEKLQRLVYQPLKEKYPDKFRESGQAVEFYTEFILNGKKVYRKLNGTERDIAVQKDIYEQTKRWKAIESSIKNVHSKFKSMRQELVSIKKSSDPARVFVFEGLLKNIETVVNRGVSCDTTLNQLSRFVDVSWILFFKKNIAKKRKNSADVGLDIDHKNKCNDSKHNASDQSAKRMKGIEFEIPSDVLGKKEKNTAPIGDEQNFSSSDDFKCYADASSKTSDWNDSTGTGDADDGFSII